jgi:hypothetical protein
MLRFGDRQFYLDWWNSTSFNVYYRTWNTLVQDWLYTYIYRDLYKVIIYLRLNRDFFYLHLSSFSFLVKNSDHCANSA